MTLTPPTPGRPMPQRKTLEPGLNAKETGATDTETAVASEASWQMNRNRGQNRKPIWKRKRKTLKRTFRCDRTPAEDQIKFEELALPEPLLKAITKLGFEEFTPIQGRSFL